MYGTRVIENKKPLQGGKMKLSIVLMTIALSVLMVGAVMVAADADESRQNVLYSCNCGKECNCNSVSIKPEDCKCGKPMKWGHILRIEENEALICTCAEGCKCNLDPKDSTKCGCGNQVKKVNLKGTGIYYCNCGGSCICNTVSDKPGKCKCGMDLKKTN